SVDDRRLQLGVRFSELSQRELGDRGRNPLFGVEWLLTILLTFAAKLLVVASQIDCSRHVGPSVVVQCCRGLGAIGHDASGRPRPMVAVALPTRARGCFRG